MAKDVAGPRRPLLTAVAATAAALILASAAYLAPQIIRIATNKGELQVEIDDPSVEVRVVQHGVEIVRPDANRWIVKAGDGVIEVSDGKDGDWLKVKEFTLTRGGRKVVRVSQQDLADARRPKGKPGADVEREVAEWLIRNSARVGVEFDGKRTNYLIHAVDKLPTGPFKVVKVGLSAPPADALMENLGRLPNLEVLELQHLSSVTENLLAHLTRLRTVKHMEIGPLEITDAGLKHLREMPALDRLGIHGNITDNGLRELRGLKLRALNLSGKGITDAGMEHLLELPDLEWLAFYDTSIGNAGLARLKALPNLDQLSLCSGQVTDAGLTSLAQFSKLSGLVLQNLPITAEGLATIKEIKQVWYLGLIGPQVTDATLARLAKGGRCLAQTLYDLSNGSTHPNPSSKRPTTIVSAAPQTAEQACRQYLLRCVGPAGLSALVVAARRSGQ